MFHDPFGKKVNDKSCASLVMEDVLQKAREREKRKISASLRVRLGPLASRIDPTRGFWQRNGVSANPKSSSSWHWAESDHWEITFHGLPHRFPWLNAQPPPPGQPSPGKPIEFPVLHLYKAVEAMVQEEPDAAHDPRFLGFMRQIDAGAGFISAMESGDFIAAEGVITDAERNSPETAYL